MVSASSGISIDLHLHTTYSDGTCTPAELLEQCADLGLGTVSVTDHDTVDGVEESIREGHHLGIKVIPGIEISARYTKGTLHILGYGIDFRDTSFLRELEQFQFIRRNRNVRIVERLQSLGIEITMSDIALEKTGEVSLGRPHIAAVLLKKGVVESMDEAFDEYLGKQGKAFVPKEVLSSGKTIDLIHAVGGLAFLAHPATLNLTGTDFDEYIANLVGEGLDGIEVYSSAHTAEQISYYRQSAERFNLLISAGSDFHGGNKEDISLGISNDSEIVNSKMISERLLELDESRIL